MQKFFVNIAFLLSLLTLILSKQQDPIILGAFLLTIAFSTLYGDKRLNFLYIVLVFPFVAFHFLPSYILFTVAIASLTSFYYTSFSHVLIPAGISLFLLDAPYVVDFYVFLGLVVAYKLMKYDSRGIVASGIIYLVFSAFISKYEIPLSDLAYFNLVFGVVSMLVEQSTVKIPRKVYVPLVLALFPISTFILPLPNAYYWWSPNSFLFSNFLSLYILGYGYNLHIDQFVLYYISSFLVNKLGQIIALHVIVFLFYFVSGLTSYLFFDRNKLLFSFIYSVLTPVQIPSLALTYSLLPLGLVIATKIDIKRFLAFSAVTISAGYVFPFAFAILSFLLNKRKEYAIFSFLLSLSWLIPYVLVGFPNESYPFPPLELYIIFTIASVLSFFIQNKYLGLALVVGSVYLALSLPYSLILYPFIILGVLLISDAKKFLIPLVLVSLVVFQGVIIAPSLSFNGVPNGVQNVIAKLENESFGLVYWNSSYSLLSPYPVTNQTALAKYIVKVVNSSNYSITINPKYISQPIPLLLSLNQTQIQPPKVSNLTNAIVKVENDSIYWEIPKGFSESEIYISFPAPETLNGTLYFEINTSNLQYFEIEVLNLTSAKLYKNTTEVSLHQQVTLIDLYYYSENSTVLKVTPYLNESGKSVFLLKKIVPFTFVEKQSSDRIFVNLNATTSLNVSVLKGYVFSVNGSKLVNSTLLKPGYYEIVVQIKTPNYLYSSITVTVIGFILSLFYVITREKLVKIYAKLIQRVKTAEEKQ